jgi:ectoine hydroxylase-related dioxygenase (phytanoyl-CoA dioxygenase family)
LLGRDARLSNFSGNRTRPGSGRMFMHADQGFVPSPWPPYAMAINVGWALDDFTAQNGGTLYVPASNHETTGPQPDRRYAEAVPVVCPAGSIFVMDGRVWHQTGENVTRDVERTGLFAFYVRPFIVPQMAWHKLVDESRESEFTPSLWSMLGLSTKPIPSLRSYSAVKR